MKSTGSETSPESSGVGIRDLLYLLIGLTAPAAFTILPGTWPKLVRVGTTMVLAAAIAFLLLKYEDSIVRHVRRLAGHDSIRRPEENKSRRWKGRLAFVLAGALVTIAVLQTLSWMTQPEATRQLTFEPRVRASDSPKQLSGRCWTSLSLPSRPDAWRCLSIRSGIGTGSLFDPCFDVRPQDPTHLVCYYTPWAAPAALFHSTSLKVYPRPKSAPPPWALLLSDGRRCILETGAASSIGTDRANYSCAPGGDVVGRIDTTNGRWTALEFLRHASPSLRPIDILEAWG